MLDKWFLEDVASGLEKSGLFVVLDEQKQGGFLLDILKKEFAKQVLVVTSEIEELCAKYEIEKNSTGSEVVIFTTIPLDKLKFLREYCETRQKLQITHLHRYITHKVTVKTGHDLNSEDAATIIAYGKLSIGKNLDFWDNVKIGQVITEDDVLRFLDDPGDFFNSLGKEGQKLFIDFMSDYTPYTFENKPVQAMANEIATAIFNGMVYKKGTPFLEKTYQKWLDSIKYKSVLKKYAALYTLPAALDIWQIPTHHPFRNIDMEWLNQLCENFSDKAWISSRLPLIKERSAQAVTKILDVDFWKDIFTLLSFDTTKIDGIHSLGDAIEHYKSYFYRVDASFRHLYTVFSAERAVIKPLQEYYQQMVLLYLDKWFKYFPVEYQENQTGLLKKILTENDPPVAIIVGDAISYEVAQEIVAGIGAGTYKIENNSICSNVPSETDNNMSSLFVASGELFATREKRQAALLQDTGKAIDFMDLDNLSLAHRACNHTIFYAPDVDEMSEKKNQGALKYYGEFIATIQGKIDRLFVCGFKKVFIVSDHGFVLTGILDESDKIEINIMGETSERYGITNEKLDVVPDHLVEIKKSYNGYEYLYFSRSINPFKTKGAYGFSHGGITPQELLTPFLKIEKAWADNILKVAISNKQELVNVVGDFYLVKCKAQIENFGLFSYERKIQIVCFKEKELFNESDIITIPANKEIIREFPFSKHDDFEVLIIDALTKTPLDSCNVKRQMARDLGGLGGHK